MLVLVDAVVDQDWAVDQLADVAASSDQGTHARESGQQINVIEKGAAEAGGGLVVIFGDAADDLVDIVQRFFRVAECVVHLASTSRAFSGDATRPASASRMPSSMAARVSSSSSSRMGAGFSRSNLCAFAIGLIVGRI